MVTSESRRTRNGMGSLSTRAPRGMVTVADPSKVIARLLRRAIAPPPRDGAMPASSTVSGPPPKVLARRTRTTRPPTLEWTISRTVWLSKPVDEMPVVYGGDGLAAHVPTQWRACATPRAQARTANAAASDSRDARGAGMDTGPPSLADERAKVLPSSRGGDESGQPANAPVDRLPTPHEGARPLAGLLGPHARLRQLRRPVDQGGQAPGLRQGRRAGDHHDAARRHAPRRPGALPLRRQV